MSARRVPIGRRPAPVPAAETWLRQGDGAGANAPLARADVFTARLTVDITADLRGRIKVAAFRQGMTVAELVRGLLEREFAATDGGR